MRRALAISPLLVACAPDLASVARSTFERAQSCPVSRVEVIARPDLSWVQVLDADATPATPSAEVAADPERLAIWRREQDELRARRARSYAEDRVYEVRGCGHHALYGCEPGYQELPASCDAATDAQREAALRPAAPR
jgi:hypothetical protein